MTSAESKSFRSFDLASPLAAELCTDLNLPTAPLADVYRYLGYPGGSSPRPKLASRISELIEQCVPLLSPRGSFSIRPITKRNACSLCLGHVVILGNLAGYMEGADRVAVFVVTIGETISEHSVNLRQSGDAFAGWVVDAFGSWAAEAAADALMKHIERHLGAGEALTLRYSPGYCGMDMSQQRKLFALLDAKAIGVELLPSLLMRPLKSISGLVGIGPKDAIRSHRSPCDRCPQTDCPMRR